MPTKFITLSVINGENPNTSLDHKSSMYALISSKYVLMILLRQCSLESLDNAEREDVKKFYEV
jgi:hypothetical protein